MTHGRAIAAYVSDDPTDHRPDGARGPGMSDCPTRLDRHPATIHRGARSGSRREVSPYLERRIRSLDEVLRRRCQATTESGAEGEG